MRAFSLSCTVWYPKWVAWDGAGLDGVEATAPAVHGPPSAAAGSFLVAVTNNYCWNRLWTFRAERGDVAYQGMRFFVVSTLALVANLAVLHVLVTLGLGEFNAQAIAIVLVTPVNFVGNKLWSFGPRR